MKLKEIPRWKQYEWLIMKTIHSNLESLDIQVIHDMHLKGEYSTRSRQVDILVYDKVKNIKTIIECKDYSSPIDVKNIESFMGMMSDLRADFGIVISTNGFTASVPKRITEFGNKIKLEHLSWITAYENSFEAKTYGMIKDICESCNADYKYGIEVPGLICWGTPIGISNSMGKIAIGYVGKCIKCLCHTVYCDYCGWLTIIENEDECCELRDKFFDFYLADNSNISG